MFLKSWLISETHFPKESYYIIGDVFQQKKKLGPHYVTQTILRAKKIFFYTHL